jgi:hypothetical protein
VKISNHRAVIDVIRSGSCNITVLNPHATTEDKTDDSQATFYEKLGYLFDCPLSTTEKNFLGDFHSGAGRSALPN